MNTLGLKQLFGDLSGLIFPRVCEVCGRSLSHGEEVLCLHCMVAMPRVKIHHDNFNSMHRRLAGKVPVERAGSYFYYYKGSPYAKLIHRAKYDGRPVIVRTLARRCALELATDGFFEGINRLLVVPLHRWKMMKRGYNQSHEIARGVSNATGIPIGDNMVAVRGHRSQTAKSSYLRWLNTEGIYNVERPGELTGKHILLIDDVMTTGATMLRCAEAIHAASPSTRISVLTLALARLS